MYQKGGSSQVATAKRTACYLSLVNAKSYRGPVTAIVMEAEGMIFSAELAHLWNASKKMLFCNIKKPNIPLWYSCSSEQVLSVSENKIQKQQQKMVLKWNKCKKGN
jgi:hypothetical protein